MNGHFAANRIDDLEEEIRTLREALDAAAAEIDLLTSERDRARDTAVRLEQMLHNQLRQVGPWDR